MADICGAKTRSGGRCKSKPMANGRCRMHGGTNTGAPKKNRHAAKPGSIYSRYYTPEEQALEAGIALGSVDAELRLTRIRLMRALARETDKPELDEITEREGAENVTAKREEKHRRRDYSGLIDKLTARIESLERRRLELILLQQQIDAKSSDDSSCVQVTGFEVVPYDDEG